MNRLRTGFLMVLLMAAFICGQKNRNDLTIFEANIYNSQYDTGNIDNAELFADSDITQQAVLGTPKPMRNIARPNITNTFWGHDGVIAEPYNTRIVSLKKIIQFDIKNNIALKLRI